MAFIHNNSSRQLSSILVAILLICCGRLPVTSAANWLTSFDWLRCSTSPGNPSTNSPVAAPTTTAPGQQPTSGPPTISPQPTPTANNDDLFTIIVMSDMENKWRGHSLDRSKYVVQYIRDLKTLDLYPFDNGYSDIKIDPALVINNGDVSHFWGCHNPAYLSTRIISAACRTPEDEFTDVWGQLYDATIPMISAYGNHDWRPRIGTGNPVRGTPTKPRDEEADAINRWSSEFTQRTYEKSVALGVGLEFEAIPPTGEIGQAMYEYCTFRGLQLASFNAAYNWQSYDDGGIYDADDQFERLSATLNRNQPTLSFSHFPLSSNRLGDQTPTSATAIDLIQEFPPGVHHFSGHYHAALVQKYNGFNDYVAPYPHTWGGREPGYLAVLVSRQTGVLQVKAMTIPGLEAGVACIPVNSLTVRNQVAATVKFLRPLEADLERGCDRCKAGQQHWSTASLGWVCGEAAGESNNNHPLGGDNVGGGDGQSNYNGGIFDSLEDETFED